MVHSLPRVSDPVCKDRRSVGCGRKESSRHACSMANSMVVAWSRPECRRWHCVKVCRAGAASVLQEG
eukprot:gene15907-biopygen6713